LNSIPIKYIIGNDNCNLTIPEIILERERFNIPVVTETVEIENMNKVKI
jgi:hypothetical protein